MNNILTIADECWCTLCGFRLRMCRCKAMRVPSIPREIKQRMARAERTPGKSAAPSQAALRARAQHARPQRPEPAPIVPYWMRPKDGRDLTEWDRLMGVEVETTDVPAMDEAE